MLKFDAVALDKCPSYFLLFQIFYKFATMCRTGTKCEEVRHRKDS